MTAKIMKLYAPRPTCGKRDQRGGYRNQDALEGSGLVAWGFGSHSLE